MIYKPCVHKPNAIPKRKPYASGRQVTLASFVVYKYSIFVAFRHINAILVLFLVCHRWQLPHCLGALDGKHIRIVAPKNSGSMYHNYKGYFSIVLLALVDSDYKILWADLGACGSSSDSQIYNASELKERIDTNTAGLPASSPLPRGELAVEDYPDQFADVPHFFIGDEIFALHPHLIKPYSKNNLQKKERIFNLRLSRARRVVEAAFGIMANRFQILHKAQKKDVDTVELITKTCVVLHNLLRIRKYDPDAETQEETDEVVQENLQAAFQSPPLARRVERARTPPVGPQLSVQGKRVRDAVRDWCCCEAGWVPWQYGQLFGEEPRGPPSSDSSGSDMDTSDAASAATPPRVATPPGPSGDAAPLDMAESDDSESTIIYKL